MSSELHATATVPIATLVECKLNVMAHAQKPDLVFQRNGRVHLYRRGCQFSRLLAAEVGASAVVMLDRPRSDTVEGCWLPTPFASFLFTSPPVHRRVPSDSVSTLPLKVRGWLFPRVILGCCGQEKHLLPLRRFHLLTVRPGASRYIIDEFIIIIITPVVIREFFNYLGTYLWVILQRC